MPPVLSIAILGCGSRGRTYAKIAASFGARYRLAAAADPVAVRREAVASLAAKGDVKMFDSAEALFAAGKLSDVLIIGTQDSQHFGHAMGALEAGYDILLEKPAAESLERCEAIDRRARELGQRVALCFVLRYTPFYSTVKALIESGRLGRVISMRTHEGVEPFHQAHSFVRGHWRSSRGSTPMIVASVPTTRICSAGSATRRQRPFPPMEIVLGSARKTRRMGHPHVAPMVARRPRTASTTHTATSPTSAAGSAW